MLMDSDIGVMGDQELDRVTREEFGEEGGETVRLVKSWDWSSPLLVRLAARTQLEDVVHSTFTWVLSVSSNLQQYQYIHINPSESIKIFTFRPFSFLQLTSIQANTYNR